MPTVDDDSTVIPKEKQDETNVTETVVDDETKAEENGKNEELKEEILATVEEQAGFPLGPENLENLEKWEGIFQSGKSQGILNRLEKSGKSQGKSHKILENSGNLR